MKLYYDTYNDKLVEVDTLDLLLFSRDDRGNITKLNNLNGLELIDDVYDEPIELVGKVKLTKINEGYEQFIQSGVARNKQLKPGYRFFIQGRVFDYYSTNIVVSVDRISDTRIDFYTLSGSHYMLELCSQP